jgi:hypothetical protein
MRFGAPSKRAPVGKESRRRNKAHLAFVARLATHII